jgi:hypothetical protein
MITVHGDLLFRLMPFGMLSRHGLPVLKRPRAVSRFLKHLRPLRAMGSLFSSVPLRFITSLTLSDRSIRDPILPFHKDKSICVNMNFSGKNPHGNLRKRSRRDQD